MQFCMPPYIHHKPVTPVYTTGRSTSQVTPVYGGSNETSMRGSGGDYGPNSVLDQGGYTSLPINFEAKVMVSLIYKLFILLQKNSKCKNRLKLIFKK